MYSFPSVSALKSSGWILTRRSICPSSSTLTRSLTRTQEWRALTQSRYPTLSLRPRRVRSFLYLGTVRLNQRGLGSGPISSQQTYIVCSLSDVCARWRTLMTPSSTVSDWKGQVHRSTLWSCKVAVDGHGGHYFTHWHCLALISRRGINSVLRNIFLLYFGTSPLNSLDEF